MQRKKLPIGIQTFRDIRNPKDNYVYVDKTEIAYQLINNGKYYFLSRPRRFGKSLFLDTLSEIFLGNKEHFQELFIYDKWDWKPSYPVVKIDFTTGNYSSKELVDEMLRVNLEINIEKLGLDKDKCYHNDPGTYFMKLIYQASKKYNGKVVILIDEYDKPILDNIGKENKKASLDARDGLRNFYSALKTSDRYLKFVFITGVSKFSRLNLFSGLNNIEDITIHPSYATITGYTQAELENEFKGYLDGVDLELVKKWYNGYNYFGPPVYNPFDILLFFSKNCEFSNYWWETGNPAFLIEKLREGHYFLPDLENISVSKETLNAFDIEYIDIVALLWQTGYLTFDKKIGDEGDSFYKMKVPNMEIQKSLNNLFFDYLCNLPHKKGHIFLSLKDALKNDNIEGFVSQL